MRLQEGKLTAVQYHISLNSLPRTTIVQENKQQAKRGKTAEDAQSAAPRHSHTRSVSDLRRVSTPPHMSKIWFTWKPCRCHLQANGKGAEFRKTASAEGMKLLMFFAALRAAHYVMNRQR